MQALWSDGLAGEAAPELRNGSQPAGQEGQWLRDVHWGPGRALISSTDGTAVATTGP